MQFFTVIKRLSHSDGQQWNETFFPTATKREEKHSKKIFQLKSPNYKKKGYPF